MKPKEYWDLYVKHPVSEGPTPLMFKALRSAPIKLSDRIDFIRDRLPSRPFSNGRRVYYEMIKTIGINKTIVTVFTKYSKDDERSEMLPIHLTSAIERHYKDNTKLGYNERLGYIAKELEILNIYYKRFKESE